MQTVFVAKKNGEREAFSEEKILNSMTRVGLEEKLKPLVLEHIKQKLHPDIKTSEIFYHIIEFLDKKDRKASFRYNLKQAIFDFGPTGFPFEKYLARIFKNLAYQVDVDVILEGDCISHEIDMLLYKNGAKSMVEAKFHNHQGVKTDAKVALYTYARFLDVKEKNKIDEVWLITNTKLTTDAIKYSECKNIKNIAWNYPSQGNLQDYVETPNLYPVTVLSSLSTEEKRRLLENEIILCADLLKIKDVEIKDLFHDLGKYEKIKNDIEMVYGEKEKIVV